MSDKPKPKTLAAALLEARKSFGRVTKDNTAKIPTKAGGSYSYKYADLTSVLEATDGALSDNGLLITHKLREVEGHALVTTLTYVETGEFVESSSPIPLTATAQEVGSWITYYRRYHITSILGLATEDDDGADASKGKTPPKNGTPKPAESTTEPTLTAEQVAAVWTLARSIIPKDSIKERMFDILSSFGVGETAKIPASKFQALLDSIEKEKK